MKRRLIIFIAFCSVMTSGCVTINYNIEVDEDEIANVKLIAEIDKKMSVSEVEKYIEENFYLHLVDGPYRHYQYNLYETDDHIVLEFQTNYPNMKLSVAHFWEFNLGGYSGGRRRELPFYISQSFGATMEIREDSYVGYVNQGHLQDDVEINLNVVLPFAIKEHNANTISKDRKTLTWNINPYETNKIHFTYVKSEFHKPIIFLVIVGTIIFYNRRKRLYSKKKDKLR